MNELVARERVGLWEDYLEWPIDATNGEEDLVESKTCGAKVDNLYYSVAQITIKYFLNKFPGKLIRYFCKVVKKKLMILPTYLM